VKLALGRWQVNASVVMTGAGHTVPSAYGRAWNQA
jgi:hypothetical protein